MAVQLATTQQILEPKQGGDIMYTDMVDEQELGESQIQKLFDGATVLVTGGTGFMGKLLVEKLLRSCNGLRKIYLLVRPKKNKSATQRLAEQFSDVLYSKLKKQQPDFMEKIYIVEGDIGKLNLGISEEDRKVLTDEVQIIFHGAATVKFNEPLKKAVEINVRGTREMFLLAKACLKLKAMVYISTAYSNCINSEIEERFYDRQISGDKLIDLVNWLDEELINKITPELLGEFQNTYIYSKSAAEDIVREYSKGLPVAVCRPSLVVGTAYEPVPGWIDNINGPTGIIVGAALGVLRIMYCKSSGVMDLIPGDIAINCCIAAAWKAAKDIISNNEQGLTLELPPPIYNNVSQLKNPLTIDQFVGYIEKNRYHYASMRSGWYPFTILTSSKVLYLIISFLMHWFPAYIVDTFAVLIGKKPMLKKIYTKIGSFFHITTYFMTNEWKFHDDNCSRLYNEMCDADKQIFDFDVASVNWEEFIINFVLGLRVHLLKDPIETISEARQKYLILKLYSKLKKQQPDFMEKIYIVEGDIGKLNLGISEEDRKVLTDEVQIIFHGAATVKFNEPLKKAVEINVRGTREMFLLAKACLKLKAMVYISTAYSNCINSEIEERFYDRQISGDKLIDLVNWLDEELINKITPELLGEFQNTYIYSKSAAEDIVREYSKGLPVAVCRPSLVVGTAYEPVPGWIDNINGPTGIIVGAALGVLRIMYCKSSGVMDLIPGDIAINCCIAAAWKAAKDIISNNEQGLTLELPPPIYNNVSQPKNPLTIDQFVGYIEKNRYHYASMRSGWYPFTILTSSKVLYLIISFLMHWFPAYIVDTFAVLIGKKPMLKKIYTKIGSFFHITTYFMTNEWKFHDDNCSRLYNEMCDADKQIFDFDVASVNWEEFIINFVLGLRVHLLKDPIETISEARQKYLILKVSHYLVSMIFVLSILSFVWYIVHLLI